MLTGLEDSRIRGFGGGDFHSWEECATHCLDSQQESGPGTEALRCTSFEYNAIESRCALNAQSE